MATSAQTFHQQYHVGRRVQELASPHRKGSIRSVKGSGQNAQITVALDGRPPANFRPAQLRLL